MELTKHILLDDRNLFLDELTPIERIICRVSTGSSLLHLSFPFLRLEDDVPAEELSKVFCSTLAGVVGDKAGMQTGDILQIPEAEGIILLVLSERQLSILWWDGMLFIKGMRGLVVERLNVVVTSIQILIPEAIPRRIVTEVRD